jgi:hypothetical protein
MSNTSPLTPPSAILGKVALHQGAAVIAKLQFVYWTVARGITWTAPPPSPWVRP